MTETVAVDLTTALDMLPRFALGHFPTPIEEAPRLSNRLGMRILIKRDDQTGLALGGNKVRKLEFLVGAALAQKADTLITTGGSQSNHARLTAAACRRAGLDCWLVLDRGVHPEDQGNMLLDLLLGAHVRLLESADPALAVTEMHALAAELREQGAAPYIIPRGGSVPDGATGYVAMAVELLTQLAAQQESIAHLYLGTGSTGTHSGTVAGLTASRSPITVQGVSVSRSTAEQVEKVLSLSNATLEHLGLPAGVTLDHVHVDDAYRGPGYGIPTAETMEAIEIAALDEGLILDPVYTGKVMAGLIGHAREGRFGATDTILFLHTGGAPALFAYHEETAEALRQA
jgi:D-cysteine desulfhydrase family pyridoxal phosphate-dependent enzyme